MTVFIQLSKHQRKDMARHEAKCRRMNKHDAQYPSAEIQQAQAKAREQELANLVEPIEVVRTNNALKAQEKYKAGMVIRRRPVEVHTFPAMTKVTP